MNVCKTCYCQRVLHPNANEDEDMGWECACCHCIIKENINYRCESGTSCLYFTLTGKTYRICSNCFNFDMDPMGDKAEQKAKEPEPDVFISEKVVLTINIIRYVFALLLSSE